MKYTQIILKVYYPYSFFCKGREVKEKRKKRRERREINEERK